MKFNVDYVSLDFTHGPITKKENLHINNKAPAPDPLPGLFYSLAVFFQGEGCAVQREKRGNCQRFPQECAVVVIRAVSVVMI